MDDLGREMGRLRKSIDSPWSDTRQKSVEKALLRRHEEQTRSRGALRPILSIVAAAFVCFVLWRVSGNASWSLAKHDSASSSQISASLVLADGSSVTPQLGADVRWAEVSPSRVTAVLQKGRAHFDVFHAEARVFRVEAGAVAVQALGTAFDVERTDDARCRVAVSRGKVRVFWAGGSADVGAGESGAYPPDGPVTSTAARPASLAASGAPGPAAVAETATPASHSAPPALPERPTWRSLAGSGAFEEAYEALEREGKSSSLHGDVSDLLLASDVARLSRHPVDAVEPLEEILRRDADDPRASLAAFTLGRVYLESLGRPHEAALAFARSRVLAPKGDLAPDALAREVEARATAGDTELARTLAMEYVRDYPAGPRLRSVRRYGGLE